MNYNKRFGKYEIRFGENGRAWRWFTTYDNALEAFKEMADEAEDFEDEGDEICLVEKKTGEVIARVPTAK